MKSDQGQSRLEEERDVGQEILQGIHDIQAGTTGRRFTAQSFWIIRAREHAHLTQKEFAGLLGVSVRTLQDWEQGRRRPSGAAETLIRVAMAHPEVLHEVASGSV